MKFILASQSPRRKNLLEKAGFSFDVVVSDADETTEKMDPSDLVEFLAEFKAKTVLESHPGKVVLGADTIVVLGNEIIGKPKDTDDARSLLKRLSGTHHKVYTGICVLDNNMKDILHEVSDVYFKELDDFQINQYLSEHTALDKAGAYNAEEATFIDKIEGSYSTVVGLPIDKVISLLRKHGIVPDKDEI